VSNNSELPPFIYQRNKALGIHERKEQMSAWRWMDDSLSVTLGNATLHTESQAVLRCDNAELKLPKDEAIRLRDYLINSYPLSEVTANGHN